jgi:hypothetical protein
MNTANATLAWLAAFFLAAIVLDAIIDYRHARKQLRRNRFMARVMNG